MCKLIINKIFFKNTAFLLKVVLLLLIINSSFSFSQVKFVNAATSDDSEANTTQTYIYNKDLNVVTGDAVIYEKTNEEEITISKSTNPEKKATKNRSGKNKLISKKKNTKKDSGQCIAKSNCNYTPHQDQNNSTIKNKGGSSLASVDNKTQKEIIFHFGSSPFLGRLWRVHKKFYHYKFYNSSLKICKNSSRAPPFAV